MKYISRSDLSIILNELIGESRLIAPKKVGGVILYQPITDTSHITWDFTRPVLSIKESFFPATERLFTIDINGQEVTLNDTLPEIPQIILGVRPCDARGMKILDALFIDTPPRDSYFAQHRANTTIIGLSCQELGETCFCTSMDGSPTDTQGMDVMLTEIEDGYSVQIITEKGKKFFGDHLSLAYEEAPPPSGTLDRPSAIPAPNDINWPRKFHEGYWDQLAERCLSCRICAYICPTCRCFTVRDEPIASNDGMQQFERIRCWDACTSEAYRQIAGGHNPRQAKKQRLRNRIYCKFDFYPKQYGPIACTGCGRCVEMCPVNIDVTEVLRDLAEVTP